MVQSAVFWDRIAERYARRPVPDEAAYRRKLEITRRYLRPDTRVLEIGCGTGSTALAHAPHVEHVHAIDLSGKMIDIARRRSSDHRNVEFHVAAAEALPLEDDSIDVAWTIHAYHHWEAPDAGIAEVARVVRPGGRFMIVETETKGAHGLSRSAADALAERLLNDGFAASSVAKHRKQLVVTGVGA